LGKSENPRFHGQNKLFLWHPALQPLGSFGHMATYRNSSKNMGKISLQSILNKNSPHALMGFDMLGVA
jgi:hypothetical protein